jgi:hypothetical protein
VRPLHLALYVAPAGPGRDELDCASGEDGGADEWAASAADVLGDAGVDASCGAAEVVACVTGPGAARDPGREAQ